MLQIRSDVEYLNEDRIMKLKHLLSFFQFPKHLNGAKKMISRCTDAAHLNEISQRKIKNLLSSQWTRVG